MQSKNFILVGSLVLLGAVVFYFSANSGQEPAVQILPEEEARETESQAEKMPALSSESTSPETNSVDEIEWLTDYDAALQQAKTEGKLVVIDFFATWCGPCKTMERITFADEKVRRRMTEFVPLKIDVDKQSKIAGRYGIQAMPTTAVVKANGQPVTGAVGLLQVDAFLSLLSAAQEKNSQ